MIKRIMSITLVVAFFLSQTVTASAFTSKEQVGPLTAGVNLTGTDENKLAVAYENIDGSVGATQIAWSGINVGDEWKVSAQKLEIGYLSNVVGWGVQIYTDNMNGAVPYSGDPTTDPGQQPAGLIGQLNTLLAVPVLILVEDDAVTSIGASTSGAGLHTPLQDDPTDPGSFFINGYDKDSDGTTGHPTTGAEIVWHFLKDRSGTIWNDANTNSIVDPGEITANFADGEDYATIVNTFGYSSGWLNPTPPNKMVRVGNLGAKDRDEDVSGDLIAGSTFYSLNVYFAANFKSATELQEYKTDTLTVEIYNP